MPLYLASASPRRRTLLVEAGRHPEVRPQDVPEERLPGEPPETMVRRLARDKARAALADLADPSAAIVLAADTAVVVDDDVLGKPADESQAVVMLQRLTGRTHRVLTGVALIRAGDGREAGGVVTTRVEFRAVADEAIRAYVATGSPLDKAGAYGLQDLDETWIANVEGSRSNVIGLPVEEVEGWLAELEAGG